MHMVEGVNWACIHRSFRSRLRAPRDEDRWVWFGAPCDDLSYFPTVVAPHAAAAAQCASLECEREASCVVVQLMNGQGEVEARATGW